MKKLFLLFIVAALSSTICTVFNEDYDETVEQFVSVAYRSADTDFSQFKTFVVADSILYVDSDKSVRKKNNLTEEVKSAVTSELTSLGYSVAAAGQAPDMIVDLAYLVSTTTTIYPGYWWGWDYWWYYDWYYPSYYPFYPYYPYPMYPVATSYSTGSLIIEIVDYANMSEGSNPPIVWHGLVRSILNSSHTSQERAQAIGQCFDMMPPVNTK